MERRLAAILAVDMVGYSRLIAADEAGTIKRQKAHRTALIDPKIAQYGGRVVNTAGDGMMVEFPSVVDAVKCAVEIQYAILEQEAQVPDDMRIQYRVGINLGDIVIDGEDIAGDGVNIAARLEGLAQPGGITVSRPVHTQVKTKLDLKFEDWGEKQVKNIPEPVTVFSILLDDKAGALVTPLAQATAKRAGQQWRIAAVAAVVLIFAIGGALWWQPWKPHFEPASVERMAFPLPEKPSIAVLPFDNLSDDTQQEYFADGLTEDIIASLSKIPNLFVISRNSSFTYKGKAVKAREVAEELGVRFVLDGSVRKDGDRARITAQLTDATSGYHVWTERYDRDAKDVFALQDDVTLNIAKALQIELTEGDQERIRLGRGTESLEAWAQAVRAVGIFRHFTKEDMARARQMFESAIELDTQYAAAWSFLGWTYWHDARWGWSGSRAESLEKALEVGQKALALDDTLPNTLTLLGSISLMKREFDQAIAYHERAVDLDPNGADSAAVLGFTLTYVGKPEEAIALLEKAMRLSPYYPTWYLSTLGRAYRLSGRRDEAIAALEQAAERNPDFLHTQVVLAVTYNELGQLARAEAKASEILEANPAFSIQDFVKGLPYKNSAELERIRAALRQAGLPEHLPPRLPDKPSIAVLPFKNFSDDQSEEYFADGMTEDLITDLSKISGLFIIARNSVFSYKGRSPKVQQVAKELGVRYVLEGSVRRAGDQVRINAQLIDTTTGGQLWADRYDGSLTDVFTLQDRVTRRIVAALALNLTKSEAQLQNQKETYSPEAYDAFLQGWEFYRRFTADDFVKAISHFEKAVELDPNYGKAYAALASVYWESLRQGRIWTSKVTSDLLQPFNIAYENTKKYTKLAMMNPSPLAHRVASALLWDSRQFDAAIAEAEKAIALDPNSPDGYVALAWALIFGGRGQEALTAVKIAMRRDPQHPGDYMYVLGMAQHGLDQHDDAVAALERALERSPENSDLNIPLAAAYADLGRQKEAQAALRRYSEVWRPFASNVDGVLGWWPFRREVDIRRFGRGLVQAGLCCAEKLEEYIARVRAGGTLIPAP